MILPYRRLGADISFPNLVEGTCREASRTCHGKSCGRFQGGKMVGGGHGRRNGDFPGEEGEGELHDNRRRQNPKERMGGGKRGKHRNPC